MAKIYGKSWWSEKWLEALYAIDIGGRLSRGKSYANTGHVKDLKIEDNVVSAKVKGSSSTPYKIIMKFKEISENDAKLITNNITYNRTVLSSLLNGSLPESILDVFKDLKISLLYNHYAHALIILYLANT